MKTFFISAILLSSLILTRAQMQTPISLWPDGAPGQHGTNDFDIPTITPYLLCKPGFDIWRHTNGMSKAT
ncbi:MAG: hypothetical protein ACREDS_12625 [Limisphaerales bacterium]